MKNSSTDTDRIDQPASSRTDRMKNTRKTSFSIVVQYLPNILRDRYRGKKHGWRYYLFVAIIVIPLFMLINWTSIGRTPIQVSYECNTTEIEQQKQFAKDQLKTRTSSRIVYNESEEEDVISIYNKSTGLVYSEEKFRASSLPILWVDMYRDIHWNEAAQREFLSYLFEKQTMEETLSDEQMMNSCLQRPFFIITQHMSGFFSRYHCFIEQFGQTLYSPWMTLLSEYGFSISTSPLEDFLMEGILRYFEPMSTCAKYSRHEKMKSIKLRLKGDERDSLNITHVDQLLYKNQLKIGKKFSVLSMFDVWKFGYEHVPVRKWMFGYTRFVPRYKLSIKFLTDHTEEHIYRAPWLTDDSLLMWLPRNKPFNVAKNHLPGDQYIITWQDQVFTGFLRYMFVLYFHRLAPRISQMTRLLAEHWSNYLADKSGRSLNDTAAIFIRRGDKMNEDTFWQKHKRWRNISLYAKGIVDEEKRLNQTFSTVFVMTDDTLAMQSIIDYSTGQSGGTDEPYARQHLIGRQIMYNVFAPQACFDPYLRIGFDQFLVSLEFIVQYVRFTVGHSDSNVGRYLEEITYSRHQLETSVHSDSYVKNAPDSF